MDTGTSAIAYRISPGFVFFVDPHGDERHHQVVISYVTYGGISNDAEVVVTGFTDAKHDHQKTCLIKTGEHSCIIKPTTIGWQFTWLIKLSDLERHLKSGQYVVKHKPIPATILNRIMAGAAKSGDLKPRFKNILRSQKLIPYLNDQLPFDDKPFK